MDISVHIALALKLLRKEYGWSLDKAAHETGVSKAMLGQIERCESSPTIATLWKIAKGFNVPFSHFLTDGLSNQTVPLQLGEDQLKVVALFPYDEQLKCEIFLIELLPGCEHVSVAHEIGVIEHVIVAEGKIELLVDQFWKPLAKGEGIRFSADQPHGYRNRSNQKAMIHDVIHYPV